MDSKLHTPEGVRDILGRECANKNEMIRTMMQILASFGYERMETPTFEYFDCFSKDIGTTPSNELYKFFDREGNTLVLRPDFTPSIARACSNYLSSAQLPIRVCYKGNVFVNHSHYQGRLRETTQLGAELIGEASIETDAEMITMAANCLSNAGLSDYNISIGHSGIFDKLCEHAGFNESEKNELGLIITNKNTVGIIEFLEGRSVDKKLQETFLKCVGMYMDGRSLDALIDSLSDYKDVKSDVEYLRELVKKLDVNKISDHVTLDLGIIKKYKYYTGIIFYGYTYGSGAEVLSGGRYDSLLSYFGKDAPAIGFAVFCDEVQKALEQTDSGKGPVNDGYLTIALGKGRLAKKAMKLFEKMGIKAEGMDDPDTRKLIFTDEVNKLRFFLAKVPDVPTYVEYGAADIGIVGYDTILEEGKNIYEVLDLGFGVCSMCVCGKPEAKALIGGPENIRVSTKYPVIAKDYFYNRMHQTVEIIKLSGSIELAPILGLSDVIVDIVETGSTLRENGLVVLEKICDLSARVVVNPVMMRMEHDRIQGIIKGLREVSADDK